jgi:hypothetical protein
VKHVVPEIAPNKAPKFYQQGGFPWIEDVDQV